MVRRVLAGAFLAVVLAGPAAAQEMLVIRDAEGTVLGPVLTVTEPRDLRNDSYLFVYRMGPNFVLLSTVPTGDGVQVGSGNNYLYFADGDCTGNPAFARINDSPPSADPSTVFPGPALLGPDSGRIWRADTASTTTTLVQSKRAASRYPGVLPCEAITPAVMAGHSIISLGGIGFLPPLSVVINPLVFNDGFGTGDPNRWTNY